MNLEKMPEIQSARVGLPPVDKVPKDGAFADKKKALAAEPSSTPESPPPSKPSPTSGHKPRRLAFTSTR